MTPEEIVLLNQLRSKLTQTEIALSDLNEHIERLPLTTDQKEALKIDACLVGEALADAKDLFEEVETFSTPVSPDTAALLANIGAATPKPPDDQG